MGDENFEEEYRSVLTVIKKEIITSNGIATIDVSKIKELDGKLYEHVINHPEESTIYIRGALESLFLKSFKIKFINISNEVQINKIRVSDENKLVSIKGLIKLTTKIIPLTDLIKFECRECGNIISIIQEKKRKRNPRKCSCGNEDFFSVILEHKKDIQELSVEESQDNLSGEPPRQVRVYLEEELTEKNFSGKLQPGRNIEIIGIIKKMPIFMTQKDMDLNVSEFILHANNIINIEGEEDLAISEEDEKQIKEIACNDPLNKLAKNLVPEVYGNEIVKKAIILQMVKGVALERSDGSMTRDDIHILLIGDPGVAKSVTLKSTSIRCPKSRMVVGTKTSRVGLGAMCQKDELTNTWALVCGSLVLCSGSLLMLDEMDKLPEESIDELLEPMSSGTSTINRAGIFASLPAQTSILASANPIHGSFNVDQPLAKQIDLPSPILNRFDLIFVLLDKPDQDFDTKAIKHIFESYKGKTKIDISIDLFKKYIIYARRIKPVLDDIIGEKVVEFYNQLRQQSELGDKKGLPINLRNIEALKRLSEANAKLRLSNRVEEQDFNVARDIFMYCLKQIGYDEKLGIYDTSRITEKIPTSRRGKVQVFLRMLYELEQRLGKFIPMEEIKARIKEKGIEEWELEEITEELKKSGNLFEPKPGTLQLI
jgi:replicative DNA helicase Mcm